MSDPISQGTASQADPSKDGGQPADKATPQGASGQQGASTSIPPVADQQKPDDGKGGGSQGAPENYETFKLSDGVEIDQSLVTEFTSVAKELNLPQDAAQKLVDLQVKAVQAATKQQVDEFEKWRSELRERVKKEVPETDIAFAAKARDRFVSAQLKKELDDTGFSDHPELIKAFAAIGKAIAEDTLDRGGDKPGGAPATLKDALYPDKK